MATGLETYDALKCAATKLTNGEALVLNFWDARDLCQLTARELESRGFAPDVAERIERDLKEGHVDALGRAMGVALRVEKKAPLLIPGEGIRRSAGVLADNGETLEDILREVDEIRHPERYAR